EPRQSCLPVMVVAAPGFSFPRAQGWKLWRPMAEPAIPERQRQRMGMAPLRARDRRSVDCVAGPGLERAAGLLPARVSGCEGCWAACSPTGRAAMLGDGAPGPDARC